MRPFKFFFAISIGILFFMFIARFIVTALIIAAFMSVLFFIGRKFKNFLMGLDWESRQRYAYQQQQERPNGLNGWNEAIKFDQMNSYSNNNSNVQTIKIH